MIKDKFIGVWKLISSEYKSAKGRISYPHGRNPVGILIYDRQGRMSVQAMASDRPLFASGNIRKGTLEEIKAAFNGYTAYFGRYEIDEKEEVIIHQIIGSYFPNEVGHERKRYFEFSRNLLTLKTSPEAPMGIIVWEREK